MATDTVLQVAGTHVICFPRARRDRSSGDVGRLEAMTASRPRALRRDTEAMILSYYQSDLAGQPYMGEEDSGQEPNTTGFEASTRQAGASNHSSSPLSRFPGETKTKSDSFGSAAVHRRKHSNNVETGAENRRVAIVPLEVVDTSHQTGPYSPSAPTPAQATLPSPLAGRRELVVDAQLAASGSALIAPPDSNLFSLHDFSSPLAPSTHSPSTPRFPPPLSSEKQETSRNAPSIQHSRTSSRDIGIVGTVTRLDLPQVLAALQDTPSDYQPPIFQIPSSSSSSSTAVDTTSLESVSLTQTASSDAVHVRPTVMSATVEPLHSHSLAMDGHGIHTQPHSAHSLPTLEQGQSLLAEASSISTAPSSYLYYQPGVHSKAGPLPPPPRAMFDIDFNAPPPPRPPRLRSPSPLNSQRPPGAAAPASVTVRLASKASAASIHQIHITTTPSVSAGSSSGDSEYSPE
ncbi:hypothetical protein BJV74DRAFT_63399 [Russula compacta]|nr:hypothetical protein BJV74DRAFT_63399 [Russula compacta]